jgi:hypothetical protein
MISRTSFASCHACAIRSRRLGPIPSTVCSSAARFSITARTSAPNRPTSFLARIGPMPLTKPLPRYRSIPSAVVGGTVFNGRRLELQSVFLVPDPPALRAQPFPCGHRRQRPDDRRLIPLPTYFHAQDTEAAFIVVEGDALDQTGDFLGRGSALWDCGIHLWGFIFPWIASTAQMPGRSGTPLGNCLRRAPSGKRATSSWWKPRWVGSRELRLTLATFILRP